MTATPDGRLTEQDAANINDCHDFGAAQRDSWLAEEFEHHLAHLPEQDDITDDEWLQHYCL